jgi:subtilisin
MNTQDNNLDLSGEFTGRYLMITAPGNSKSNIKSIKETTGINLASSLDFENSEITTEGLEGYDGFYLNELGVAVISAAQAEQMQSLSKMSFMAAEGTEENAAPIIEPERVCRTIDENFGSYLKGFSDAAKHLSENYGNDETAKEFGAETEETSGVLAGGSTWGLQATNVVPSGLWTMPYTGNGIKVAVLDTGFDNNHPDFAGRSVVAQSFVPGQPVQDGHGHGTHCIGTACGPLTNAGGVDRYGIAYQAQIFVGKVLNNAGSGADGWILAGINWAVANRCQVISMSLGAAANGAGFSAVYENAARAALNVGCLIVAAAGNSGNQPVGHPANCPSIMAVGSVDSNLQRSSFSCITFYPPHGKVDIAGPGRDVFSTAPMPRRYATMSGTSMATPHVAGIAALHAQSNAAYRGGALWARLTATAKALPQPVTHVGSGLVQAPYRRIFFPFPFPIPPIAFPRPIPFPTPVPFPPITGPIPPRPFAGKKKAVKSDPKKAVSSSKKR